MHHSERVMHTSVSFTYCQGAIFEQLLALSIFFFSELAIGKCSQGFELWRF
jgi:hypothetical protein